MTVAFIVPEKTEKNIAREAQVYHFFIVVVYYLHQNQSVSLDKYLAKNTVSYPYDHCFRQRKAYCQLFSKRCSTCVGYIWEFATCKADRTRQK